MRQLLSQICRMSNNMVILSILRPQNLCTHKLRGCWTKESTNYDRLDYHWAIIIITQWLYETFQRFFISSLVWMSSRQSSRLNAKVALAPAEMMIREESNRERGEMGIYERLWVCVIEREFAQEYSRGIFSEMEDNRVHVIGRVDPLIHWTCRFVNTICKVKHSPKTDEHFTQFDTLFLT